MGEVDRFNSYFEGRNVRTCSGSEMPGFLGTNVQWMMAFIDMGKIGRMHSGTGRC